MPIWYLDMWFQGGPTVTCKLQAVTRFEHVKTRYVMIPIFIEVKNQYHVPCILISKYTISLFLLAERLSVGAPSSRYNFETQS